MKKTCFALLLFLPLLLAACDGEQYGTGLNRSARPVKVQDVFFRPELRGQTVLIEGQISSQCQSNGCWFVLQDETGQLYIDLSRNNFTLPARTGREVKASGIVAAKGNNLFLIAQGVEVK